MDYQFLKNNEIYKRHKKLCIIGVIVFLGVVVSTAYYVRQNNVANAVNGGSKNQQTTVDSFTVARADVVKNISLSGQTVPKSQVDIAAKYAGKVTAVDVELGQAVTTGDVLVVQDTQDAEVSIRQNQAAYEQAVADATTTEASTNANYIKAQSDYKRAVDSYQRYKTLYDVGAISKEALDTNAQSMAAAKAALDLLENQMHSDSGVASSIVAGQAAALKAQYTVEAMQTQRDALIIRAPRSGIIGYRQVEVGSMLASGQKILSIVDNSEMYVDCQVAAEDLLALWNGMAVDVNLPAVGKTLHGKVIYISLATDATTQTFSIRVRLDKPNSEIRGGLFSQINLTSILRANTISVPNNAILEKNGKTYVAVIDSQNVIEERTIQVGAVGSLNTEVLSGLKEGENIAVSNLSRLYTGIVVTPNRIANGDK